MAKRSHTKHTLAAERRRGELELIATNLIKLRGRLRDLLDHQKSGQTLSLAQSKEAQSLAKRIVRLKVSLIKAGVSPNLIANTAKMSEHLNNIERIPPTAINRSGGVGAYRRGNSMKLWKSGA